MTKMVRVGFCSFCLGSISVPESEMHHFWDFYIRVEGKNYHLPRLVAKNHMPFSVRCDYSHKMLEAPKEVKDESGKK